MPCHLYFDQWVPYSVDHVFAFFSNPENLPRIMPAASGTRLLLINRMPTPPRESTLAAGIGSTIVTSFRLFPFLPIRARWVARITEFEWDHHFVDVQDKGPLRSWRHRHEFVGETRNEIEGTIVSDAVDYEVGFGFLGETANKLFIRRQIRRTFAHRQNVMESILAIAK
jgi:ligand-binding SRPBCC domain-containing protein